MQHSPVFLDCPAAIAGFAELQYGAMEAPACVDRQLAWGIPELLWQRALRSKYGVTP